MSESQPNLKAAGTFSLSSLSKAIKTPSNNTVKSSFAPQATEESKESFSASGQQAVYWGGSPHSNEQVQQYVASVEL